MCGVVFPPRNLHGNLVGVDPRHAVILFTADRTNDAHRFTNITIIQKTDVRKTASETQEPLSHSRRVICRLSIFQPIPHALKIQYQQNHVHGHETPQFVMGIDNRQGNQIRYVKQPTPPQLTPDEINPNQTYCARNPI
jgi:hypothetical protein